jgi:nitrilase
MGEVVNVAAVQAAPVFLDREATIAKTLGLIEQAAGGGAQLIVFPEVFISGYPFWLWGDQPAVIPGLEQKAFARLWEEGIDVPGPVVDQLGEAARAAGAYVMIGVNERESSYGRGTLYNSLLTFSPEGELVGHRRKLVPTYKERTVWGAGDGSTLDLVETPLGRIAGMICWENFMPIARYHAYAQGATIYVAVTMDDSPSWLAMMQAIAAEARIFVISVCQQFDRTQFPDEPALSGFKPDDATLMSGNSVIVAPGGEIIAGPVKGEETILTAELDLSRIVEEKHSLDVTGHYARHDVFRVTVNTKPNLPFDTV